MSTEITVVNDIVEINVTEDVIVIEAPSGAYPLPTGVYSVYGRTGNVVAQDGDYNLTQLGDVTITNASTGQVLRYNGTTWVNSTESYVGTVTSVGLSNSGNALAITNSPITTAGTINIGFAGTGAQYIKGDGTLATFPTTIQQAQRLITEVYNSTGATLSKGTIVYINGGQGNLPTVTKAIASGDATSAQTYGVVQSDITNNNNGYVVVIGSITDLDTQAYPVGTQLYLSGTTAGAWTSTKPYAPIHLVYVGIVVRSHPTQGVVEVRIQNGYELDELHDVSAQNPNNGDILQYVAATDLWAKTAGTTTNIAEGTNLYYTDARSRAALSATTPLTYNSTTGAFGIQQASGTQSGFLSSTDWTTFNNKQNALGYTPANASTTISTTVPLAGGGDLSANRTLSITQSSTSTDGYLSSTDWNTFNNKQNAITLTTTGTSGAATFVGGTLNIPQYQAVLTNPVTGTGTANTLPKFTGTSAIGNSNITDTGSLVTIASKLTLSGAVTGVGNTSNYTVTASAGLAASKQITSTLVAAANNDTLVGLDINPTFTNGAFTGVTNLGLRVAGNIFVSLNQNAVTEVNISNTTSGTNSLATLKATSSGGNIQLGKNSATTTAYKILSANNGFIYNSTSDLAILSDQGGSSIKMTANGASLPHLQIFSTGNIGINTANSDAGFRLDVNGTARIQNQLTTIGSITAASAIARGVYFNNTLVAAANNDVLVGLDINPTFTLGAFTGVTRTALRLTGDMSFASISSIGIKADVRGGLMWLGNVGITNSGTGLQAYQFTTNDTNSAGTMIVSQRNASSTATTLYVQQLGTGLGLNVATGNTVLGATGSTTYKLEVNGSGIFNGTLTAVPSLTVAGSITATSLARGLLINPTLIASANNDGLIGLDINPSFTNGAFTGVSNYAMRVVGTTSTYFFSSGNIGINQLTDAGFKLDVNGTFRQTGSTTAASALAVGSTITPTLVAAANNDVLVGMDINPTFTNGAFTSVRNYAARFNGNISVGTKGQWTTYANSNFLFIGNASISSSNQASGGDLILNANSYYNGTNYVALNTGYSALFNLNPNNDGRTLFQTSALTNAGATVSYTTSGTIFQTGNWLLGTGTTDAGYKLDVNGTARVQGQLTITSSNLNINTGGLNRIVLNGGTQGEFGYGVSGNGFNHNTGTYISWASTSQLCFGESSGTTQMAIRRDTPNSRGTIFFGYDNALGGTVVASALVSMESTTQGFLPPRMTTTQKNAIATPATGLMVFDTTLAKLCVYTGSAWETIISA